MGLAQGSVAKISIRVALLAAVFSVFAATVRSSTQDVAAANGLQVDASYVYRLDTEANLTVEATFDLKNVKPNSRSGNTIYSYYFDGFAVPLPDNAVDVAVTDGTNDLSFEVITEEFEPEDGDEFDDGGEFTYASVRFRRNLNYGRTTKIVATYRIEGSEPRAEFIDRLNPAYALFGAWGLADPGRLDVTIELPAGYEIETVGNYMPMNTTEDGGRRYVAEDIEDPDDFFVTVIARNNEALVATPLDVADSQVTIRSWPGDDEWQQFAERNVTEGIPVLEKLVGLPWPEDEQFEILQSSEPNFHGYAGWYDSEEGQIIIDESLDTPIFLHELSHAWFNDKLTEDRWITEAMADEFARLAALELDEDAPEPDRPKDGYKNRYLNTWSTLTRGEDAEEWGYTVSAWVMFQLSEDVGAEAMDDIAVALFEGTAAYPDEDGDGRSLVDVDWKRLLDVAENIAGAEGFQTVLSDWVLLKAEEDLLAQRNEAQDEVERLAEAGGDWFVPNGLRNRLETWEFDDVERLVEEGLAVLASRDELADRSIAAGFEDPAVAEGLYERAFHNYSASEKKLAQWLEAIGVVESITERHAIEPSLVEQIGLWGQDPDAELLEVRDAYEAGDLDLVDAEAAQLRSLLDDADEVGAFRVKVAAAIAGAILLLVIIFIVRSVLKRRRRKRFDAWRRELDEKLPDLELTGV
ncbi:MAG: hypothetical protein R2770_12605 [Acidimicrobiales bacterium]